MNKPIEGIKIVDGKGFGKAYFVGRAVQQESVVTISRQDVGDHIMLFNEIRTKAKSEYRSLFTKMSDSDSSTIDSSILNIYEHILDDPAFIGQVVETITTRLYDLETAIRNVSNDFIKRFNSAGTSYFRERSSDMVEICEKLISFVNVDNGRPKTFAEPIVLVVLRAFTPSDILNYDISMIKAVLSVSGGKTSHAAILARSYNIPVISGIDNLSTVIHPGDEIYVDADNAQVFIRPDADMIANYRVFETETISFRKKLESKWNRPVYTKDGIHIEVLANISLPEETIGAMESGADGVGLVRSEYLLSNRKKFPPEDVQIEFYKKIYKAAGKKETIIRMMDIGGDKIPEFFNMPVEFNPFMGWRAIRVLLERKELFETQLVAIMKAAKETNAKCKIMFPMVTTISEWLDAKEFVYEISNKEGLKIPELGILFEVPLSILEMTSFIKEIDFASIGTNDLLQYLSAADRNNPKVNYLYNPIDPAFLRILKNAIETSTSSGVPISICGEMAGDPLNAILLVGLGLRRFSVVPRNISVIKDILSNISFVEVAESVKHLFAIDSPEGISRWIKSINAEVFDKVMKKK